MLPVGSILLISTWVEENLCFWRCYSEKFRFCNKSGFIEMEYLILLPLLQGISL